MNHVYYRENWMSDVQFECFQMLCDIMGGGNHLCGTPKPCGTGIEINTRHFYGATFDYDKLTKAVILAHDRCIRFEVSPSGPGMLKLSFHKRSREGVMCERHPTLAEAIGKYSVKEQPHD